MKILICGFILLLLSIAINANAQSAPRPDSALFASVLTKYLRNHARYPAEAKEKEVGGQVVLSFRVNPDQKLSDIKIVKDWNLGPGDAMVALLKSFRHGYAIKPDEYTFSVLFEMMGNDGKESKVTDDVIIKNPELVFKNYLGEVVVIGYGSKMRIVQMSEEVGIMLPDFNAHKGKVKTLITNRFDTYTDNGELRKGKLVEHTVKHFDSKGNTLDYTTFNVNGAVLRKTLYKYSNSKLKYIVSTFDQNKIPYERRKELYNSQGKKVEIDYYKVYSNGRDSLTFKNITQYNDMGLKVLEADYNMKTNKISSKFSLEYNDKGLETMTAFSSNEQGTIYNSHRVFKYSNTGLRLMDTFYQGTSNGFNNPPNDTLITRTFFVYDNKGSLTTDAIYNYKGVITEKQNYTYNDKGKQIEHITYRADGKQDRREVSEYDNRNNRTNFTQYFQKGYVFKNTDLYDYSNHVLEHASYNNGILVSKTINKFDDEGNKVEEISGTGNAATAKKLTFTYDDRDAQGNWRKANWTDVHDSKLYMVEREITYYR